jgi:ribosomal protein S18 acetylase RimI-like enzyme
VQPELAGGGEQATRAAERWLRLATQADLAGEGEEARQAREAVEQMMHELFLYAERARWPFAPLPAAEVAPLSVRQLPRDDRQKLFIGSLEPTGAIKANGKPEQRCVTSLAPLSDGRVAGALPTDEAVQADVAGRAVQREQAAGAPERLWVTCEEWLAAVGADAAEGWKEAEGGSDGGEAPWPHLGAAAEEMEEALGWEAEWEEAEDIRMAMEAEAEAEQAHESARARAHAWAADAAAAAMAEPPQPDTAPPAARPQSSSTANAATVESAAASVSGSVERIPSGGLATRQQLDEMVQLTEDNMCAYSPPSLLAETRRNLALHTMRGVMVREAGEGGRLLAFAAYRLNVKEGGKAVAYLYELQLVTAARGSKPSVGKALLAEVEQRAARAGRSLQLSVTALNVRAVGFYELGCGYERIDERTVEGVSVLTYEKPLERMRECASENTGTSTSAGEHGGGHGGGHVQEHSSTQKGVPEGGHAAVYKHEHEGAMEHEHEHECESEQGCESGRERGGAQGHEHGQGHVGHAGRGDVPESQLASSMPRVHGMGTGGVCSDGDEEEEGSGSARLSSDSDEDRSGDDSDADGAMGEEPRWGHGLRSWARSECVWQAELRRREEEAREDCERVTESLATDSTIGAEADALEAETATRDEAPRVPPQDAQFLETLPQVLADYIRSHPVLRVFARKRDVETDGVSSTDGTHIAMEEKEKGHIAASLTQRALWAALRLHLQYTFHEVVAVDGSYDAASTAAAHEVAQEATAWGSYDGCDFRGGTLPPSSGNHAAELVAVERTLFRFGSGTRVLILSDCQGALRAVEAAWRGRNEAASAHDERVALRKRASGTVVEAITDHRMRICQQGGDVVFLYTPAHRGGVSANAYADAAAKSHLAGTPSEPPLQVTSRLCVYSQAAGGHEWRLPADKPVYTQVHQLAMRHVCAEGARAGGKAGSSARPDVCRPWEPLLRLERRKGQVRAGGRPSEAGRALSARAGHVGACDECAGSLCSLCDAPFADALHKLSGECTAVPQPVRDAAVQAARAALARLEALLPRLAVEAPTDDGAPPPRRLQHTVVQEPRWAAGHAGEPLFTFRRAHAGQCAAGERLMVEPGSTEDRALTHWLAWAIVRAGEEAAAASRLLAPTMQLVVDAVHALPPDEASGTPTHTGGIVAVHVLFDQLCPLVDESHGRVRIAPDAWAAAAVEEARAKGAHGYVQTARRSLQAGQGAEGRRRYEAYASAPDGSVHWVTPCATWCQAIHYLVVVAAGDQLVLLHIRQEAARAEGKARSGSQGGVRSRAAQAADDAASAGRGSRGTRIDVIDSYASGSSITSDASTSLPRTMPAISSTREAPHRMITTCVRRARGKQAETATVCVLHRACCERHAAGAMVDVGRRTLFEAHRWPGAPSTEEPVHAQIATARQALEGAAQNAHLSEVRRGQLASAVTALMGNQLETPSAAVRAAMRQAAQESAASGPQASDGELLIAVAGSRRDGEADPGPGPGVHSCSIERGAGGALCNPFPMGEAGHDERRRTYVVALHKRWLRATTVRAADMLTSELGPLPVDVRPQGDNADLTGEMVMTQLRAVLREARLAQAEAVRLECGPRCRAGHVCHGDNLAAQLRQQRAMPATPPSQRGAALSTQVAAAQDMQDERRAAAPTPVGLVQHVHLELRTFADSIWRLVDARQRQRQLAREREAAEHGTTWQELRARRAVHRRAAARDERRKARAEQLAMVRADGKRRRGAPRAARPPPLTAAEAVAAAEAGHVDALRDNWIVEVPLALWGGVWHGRRGSIAASIEEALMAGTGVWAKPCGSVLSGTRVDAATGARERTRWWPTEVALRWEDLRAQRLYGSEQLACQLLSAAEHAGGDEAESGDEAVQVRREAAEAARGAAADRRRARQRMRALAVLAVEEEEEDAEAEQQGGPADGAEEAGALAEGERSGGEGDGAAASATAAGGAPSRRKRSSAQVAAETELGEASRARLLSAAGGAPPPAAPLPLAWEELPWLVIEPTPPPPPADVPMADDGGDGAATNADAAAAFITRHEPAAAAVGEEQAGEGVCEEGAASSVRDVAEEQRRSQTARRNTMRREGTAEGGSGETENGDEGGGDVAAQCESENSRAGGGGGGGTEDGDASGGVGGDGGEEREARAAGGEGGASGEGKGRRKKPRGNRPGEGSRKRAASAPAAEQ